jgi:Tfp pilus assembly protein PilF
MDLLLLQQWKMIASLLRRAQNRLPTPCEEAREEFERAVAVAMDYLDHNEFELALDSLTDAAEHVPSRGGVWRDLERAAQAMELHAKAAYLRQKFEKSLSRVHGPGG